MYRTLCILGLALTATLATAQVTFSSTKYGTGTYPEHPVTGDFNRDGKPDFAVLANGNELTIYLNIGSGKFAQKAHYSVVTNFNETRLDTADLNGDGILDIVIGKQYDSTFEIWWGNGDGTFTFGKDVNVGAGDSLDFALGDVNNDGKVDFLYQYNDDTSSYVHVLLNDGAGNFSDAGGVVFPTFTDNWAMADFDRDGKLDVVARMGTTLQEYSGDGTGKFVLNKTSTVAAGSGFLTIGSFNHDATPDLALIIDNCGTRTCDANSLDKVYVYLNDGTGHFGLRSSYTAGTGYGRITADDLTGDEVQDIAIAGADFQNGTAVRFETLLNQGTGFFNGPYSEGTHERQDVPALRDMNLDGRHDAIFAADTGVYSLLNQSATVACTPPSSAKLTSKICGPANNATVAKTFTVRGSGNSTAGIYRMELWVDGKKSSEVLSDQIKKTITVSAAKHRIAVVAVDRFGKSISSAIYVIAQ
jgi:FG-GAP-like repeat